jgi:hypothetical protein
MGVAEVELVGGPEDGKTATVPIGSDGIPMSPIVRPSGPPPSGSDELVGELDPVAKYERHGQDSEGRWRYLYTGVELLGE